MDMELSDECNNWNFVMSVTTVLSFSSMPKKSVEIFNVL